MKTINNFDFTSCTCELTEFKGYAGEFCSEAYDMLEIDGTLEGDEWCDIMKDDEGNEFAVYGDNSIDGAGEFYFKKL